MAICRGVCPAEDDCGGRFGNETGKESVIILDVPHFHLWMCLFRTFVSF